MSIDQRLTRDARHWSAQVDLAVTAGTGTSADPALVEARHTPHRVVNGFASRGPRIRRLMSIAAAVVVIVAAGVIYRVIVPSGNTTSAGDSSSSASAHVRADAALIPILTSLPSDAVSEPWRLDEVQADGRELAITYVVGGGCEVAAGARVQERATRVEIMMVSRSTRNGGFCAAELIIGRGVIRLRRPLGARSLVHAWIPLSERHLLR